MENIQTITILPLPGADVALRVAVKENLNHEQAYLRFFLLPADPRREMMPIHPDPEDQEWAIEALAALRIGWVEPRANVLQILVEELALRRAVARRFGRDLAGMTMRAIPDRQYRGQEGYAPCFKLFPIQKVPLLWMGVLVAWRVPGTRGGNGGNPRNILRGSEPLRSLYFSHEGTLNIPIRGAHPPEELWEVARALELEVRVELPNPSALAKEIRESIARAVYLFHRAPLELRLARWEEMDQLLNHLQELETRAHSFLEQAVGEWPVDPAAVRELQEALEELRGLFRQGDGRRPGLPRTLSERAARRREWIMTLAGRRQPLARGGVVAEVGLVRAWIRPDGEIRPLHELPDDHPGLVSLLEEEAERLEELAARYRRRAGTMERRAARRAPTAPGSNVDAEPGRPRYLYAGSGAE